MSKNGAVWHEDIFEEMSQFESEKGKESLNGGFKGLVLNRLSYLLEGLAVDVEVCPQRLESAHESWVNDIDRVSTHEMGGGPLDYFKRSAYFSYWLRRRSPVIKFNFDEEYQKSLKVSEAYYLDFLNRYINEHLAFDLAREICLNFTLAKDGFSTTGEQFSISSDFVHDLNYCQKEKNLSPQAMNLILRSLFGA